MFKVYEIEIEKNAEYNNVEDGYEFFKDNKLPLIVSTQTKEDGELFIEQLKYVALPNESDFHYLAQMEEHDALVDLTDALHGFEFNLETDDGCTCPVETKWVRKFEDGRNKSCTSYFPHLTYRVIREVTLNELKERFGRKDEDLEVA